MTYVKRALTVYYGTPYGQATTFDSIKRYEQRFYYAAQ